MNENTKTILLLALAALVVLAVWSTKPRLPQNEETEKAGAMLFADFKDPTAATSLEIVKYDEQTGDVIPFEVSQVGGVWSIPSHDNYPADAKEHLAEAANSLIDLEILSIASDNAGDHELYGVLDPTDKEIKSGTPGVGTKVVMKDAEGKTLASLVIGKTTPDQPGLRFVRRVGQSRVYTVAISTEKLSTKFDDWIEEDLLKLDSWDITQLFIQDYSVDESRGALTLRSEITLAHNDTADPKWTLISDKAMDADGNWQPIALEPNEELNTERLDAMKTALDDLKIVDVARKPAGLSADLAAEKSFADNKEAIASLMQRGFYLANAAGKTAIYSNEGEVRCLMKDGVEYVLRFGNLADATRGAEAPKEDAGDGDTDGSGLNRYLFVMAEFNPEGIPKPELQPLPKADEEKPEAEGDKEPAETDTTDDKTNESDTAEEKPEAEAQTANADAERKAEVERIEKENKRKQDEYDAKVAEGEKRVAELNKCFADWYYVISESVYKKIHLGRDDLIKKKEPTEDAKSNAAAPAADAVTPDAFEQLKSEPPGTAEQ